VVCGQLLTELAARGHRIRAVAPITDELRHDGDEFDRQHPRLTVTRFAVPYFERYAFTGADTATDEYRDRERAGLVDTLRPLMAAEPSDALLIGRDLYAWYVDDIVRTQAVPSLLISHGGPTTAIAHGTWPPERAARLLSAMSSADVVVAVARHWKDALIRLGLPRVVSIPNPVDLARFTPGGRDPELARALDIGPADVVVLHASNLSTVKRLPDVIEAVGIALRQDPRLVCVVIGDGPQRPTAEELCRRRGLTGRFRFLGWVDHEAVPAHMRLADLVVVASAHETQSLVCLEAQASERCLVASDVPGAREIVTHGETGWLFPVGDVPALADLLLAGARDPDRRAAIGRAGRARARAHALPRVVDAYERLVAALARTAGGRPCRSAG
jgi:glycosyltransferase involved in cell wall biosynthesis